MPCLMCILNFIFHNRESEHFHHQVKLVDLHTKEVFYDKLTFIYLEMPKFNKTEAELVTMFDKWMFVLRNLSNLLERPAALQERIFNRLFQAAEIAAFTPQRRSEYWESLKNYRDWKNVLDTNMKKSYHKGMEQGLAEGRAKGRAEGLEEGRAKGLEEGLEKGRAKGSKEAALAVAEKMKSKGYSDEDVVEMTGLSLEDIAELS